ncbi:MAG: transglycosylase domain-containing protein [Myxococcales bacterium]|nr:transglycosylase domain-containing protein [Myxococcales bacterium]
MLRRLVLGLLGLAVALTTLALGARPHLIDREGRRAAEKVARRIGLPVAVERVLPWGWTGASVERVRVGPPGRPLVTVRRTQARLTWSEALWGPRRPQALSAEGVVLHIHGDGTLEGAAKALRASLPEPPEREAGEASEGGGGGLPSVTVTDVQVLDHGGAVSAQNGRFTLSGGAVTGEMVVTRPALGRCTVEGDRHRIALACESPLSLPLPAGLRVEGDGIEVQLKPRRAVILKGVRVAAGEAKGRLAHILGGLTADLRVELAADAQGRYPVSAGLRLANGAAIEIDGVADRDGAVMGAQVADFPLHPVHKTLGGRLSGSVDLTVDRKARRVVLDGKAELAEFTLEHPAVAESAIGPVTLSLGGRIEASAPPDGPLGRGKIELKGGRLAVGDVKVSATAAVDATGKAPVVSASLSIPPVPANAVAQAIPQGLMPHLQPLTATGRFGLEAALRIDFADLPATVLTATLDLERLALTELNPEVNLESLRQTFTTTFVLPDDTIHERITGPESERWVPLHAIPPLLPLAVVTQEDGGFYRHGGVSLFHLRASLVRNLERGRFARGGSTLTMQLARNLFLHRRKTLARKLEELVVTWLLEKHFEKDELMGLYLNVVEFGEGVYGIKDAAEYYFAKAPFQLDPVEIAFLVRLLPSPRRWGKQKEKGKVEAWYAKRIERLLALLVERGHLSPALRDAARPGALFQGATMDPDVWQAPAVPPPPLGADGQPVAPDDLTDPFGPELTPLAPVAPEPPDEVDEPAEPPAPEDAEDAP